MTTRQQGKGNADHKRPQLSRARVDVALLSPNVLFTVTGFLNKQKVADGFGTR